jgi:hypothetical protein
MLTLCMAFRRRSRILDSIGNLYSVPHASFDPPVALAFHNDPTAGAYPSHVSSMCDLGLDVSGAAEQYIETQAMLWGSREIGEQFGRAYSHESEYWRLVRMRGGALGVWEHIVEHDGPDECWVYKYWPDDLPEAS